MRIFTRFGVEWRVSQNLVPYSDALSFMEGRATAIREAGAPECVWLLEHPPLYTEGSSARPEDLLEPGRFPVYRAGRGGQYTYHGPGQRVVYAMLDLKKRKPDVRDFVCGLEQWAIDALAELGVAGERRAGRVGIWVVRPDGREEKICAIGVRLRRWVSFHGLALNVHPDLSHFDGIVPCGISDHGVTSLKALGKDCDMEMIDRILIEQFGRIF